MAKTYWWTSGSGELELEMTREMFDSVAHPGKNDEDVAYLLLTDSIDNQTARWDPDVLSSVLSEYGSWDDSELKDHEQNVARMVWIASWDLYEENVED